MKLLLLVALVALPLAAQPQQVTCDDGSVWTISPFNPDPCRNLETEVAAPEYPIDFLMVYGMPPEPTGDSLRDRIARAFYAQNLKNFRGFTEPPANFPGSVYSSWGLGEPLFFATQYGKYVRFPDALGSPCQVAQTTAVLGAGVVVATCQVRAIQTGACLPTLQQFVPQSIRRRNADNCAPEEGQE